MYWAGEDVTTLFAQVLSYAVIVMVYKPTCASSLLCQLTVLPTPRLSVTPLIQVFVGLIEFMYISVQLDKLFEKLGNVYDPSTSVI